MAVNPITSDDLTIDLASLLSLSVSDRVQAAASDPGFAQALMQALTPIQLAKAFPDYYRRELPDISNFILANRYLDSGGRFDQYGGGDYGEHKDMHSGDATLDNTARPTGVPTPTLEEMKAKLLEKGIDVDNIYKSVSAEGISIDDEKVKVLKNLSSDQLTKMGFEQFEDDSGKKKIRLLPTETASLSDEQIIKRAESRRLDPNKFMDPMTSGKLRPEIVSKYQGKRLPVSIRNNNMGAISLKDDSNTFVTDMPGYLDKTERPANEGGYYARYATPEHGVAAASRNLESYARQGVNTPSAIVLKWADDGNQNYINTVVKYLNDAGYEVNQNSTLDLTDPKVRMAILKGKSAFESGAGMPVYTDEVFETGVNYTFESPIDPNKQYTPEEIKELRKKDEQYQISQRQDDAVRALYNLPSPTSSDYISVSSNAKTVDEEVDNYLWNKYMQTAPYKNADGYRSDQMAAEAAGMSLKDFVIGGADKNFKLNMYTAGQQMDTEGVPWGINSMYRNEYRNQLAYGGESGHLSHHGTESLGYTYGTGKAVDLSSVGDVDREVVYKWIDEKGGSFGVARPYGMGGAGMADAPHVGPLSSSEMTNNNRLMRRQGYASGQEVLGQLQAAGGYTELTERQRKIIEEKLVERNAQQTNTSTPEQNQATNTSTPEQNQATNTSTAPEIQSFQFGGTPTLQDDEDLTAVGPDGKPKFKFNSGEGLYVKPEANEYADDKINELSGRLDKMAESQNQPQRKMSETQEPKSDPRWAEKVASAYRPSGTQQRAFNRAQFRSEGRHVGDRGSPNIA